jgi:hypothetical protein
MMDMGQITNEPHFSLGMFHFDYKVRLSAHSFLQLFSLSDEYVIQTNSFLSFLHGCKSFILPREAFMVICPTLLHLPHIYELWDQIVSSL